ncbi:MAG: hypothetical protein ACLPV8_25510 [Steroidobacteraceae bacterium]
MTSQQRPINLQEIQDRVERMRAAVGDTKTTDTSDIKVAHGVLPDGHVWGVFWDFQCDVPPAQLQNIAQSAIDNVHKMYEHCEHYAATHSISASEVKAVYQGSRALKIISDLHNLDKHAAQAPNQSGVSPRLSQVRRVPWINPGKGRIEFEFPSGAKRLVGDAYFVIDGPVMSMRTNKKVTTLGEILEEGVSAWEGFLRKHQIV